MMCCFSRSVETATYGLYCVFDGHNGVAAAQHIHDNLCEVRTALSIRPNWSGSETLSYVHHLYDLDPPRSH